MSNNLEVAAVSLAAAFGFALSTSLKHISARSAPDAQNFRPGRLAGFARATLSHPLWLAGIVCDIVAVVLQIIALYLGALSLVQPILICGLIFALILRPRFTRQRVTARELFWAVILTGALAGFLVLGTTSTSTSTDTGVDPTPAVIVGAIGAVLAIVCVELGRRQRRNGTRAALIGIAVGVLYAAAAGLLKALTALASSPVRMLESWQLYTVVVVGAVALLLNQLAFQAAPLSASLPATATVDPLLSVVIGVAVFDEPFHLGPGHGTILAGLLAVIGGAVILLARTSAPNDAHATMTSPTQ